VIFEHFKGFGADTQTLLKQYLTRYALAERMTISNVSVLFEEEHSLLLGVTLNDFFTLPRYIWSEVVWSDVQATVFSRGRPVCH